MAHTCIRTRKAEAGAESKASLDYTHNVTRPYKRHKKKKITGQVCSDWSRCGWPGNLVLKAGPALRGQRQASRFDSSKPRYGPKGVPLRGSSFLSPGHGLGRSRPTMSSVLFHHPTPRHSRSSSSPPGSEAPQLSRALRPLRKLRPSQSLLPMKDSSPSMLRPEGAKRRLRG